jgi:hypothetical protein
MTSDAQAPVKLSLPLVNATHLDSIAGADDIIGIPARHLH